MPHPPLAYYRDLPPAEKIAVDAHLATCAECRALLASYQQQDAALAQLPTLRPKRRLLRPAVAPRNPIAMLGNTLAVGGLAAIILAVGLAVQTGSGLVPASGQPEPGYTLPPSIIATPSPWIPALPWLGLAALIVGGLFTLTRTKWPPLLGAALSGLLLISFIAPFSSLPNPLAIYWRAVGGYSYDPRLPFKNAMLIAGDPAQQIRPHLDKLIGTVGLSPLDPVQPLARYEILNISLHPQRNRTALVTTRFIYADGSSRVYPIPLLGPTADLFGFYLSGWRADGLERLRSYHLALPNQPFATAQSPITLGPTQRLDALHLAAQRLDETNPSHWLWESTRIQRLVYAPDASAFLTSQEPTPGQRQLWRVPLDGTAPTLVATGDIREYGWSPDSTYIVYTHFDPAAANADPFRPFAIVSLPATARDVYSDFSERAGRATSSQIVTALPDPALPGLTAQGIWFFSDSALWLAAYTGGAPTRLIANLPDPRFAPRPTPDGQTIAYACGGDVCFSNVGGERLATVARVTWAEASWNLAGTVLATIDRDPNNLRPVYLRLLTPAGETVAAAEIAPLDVTDAPQWTPDDRAIFVQTYPQHGRRIIAYHLPTAQVLDLSQERWDTYFTLAPDGQSLLLNNGRGDYWEAAVNVK